MLEAFLNHRFDEPGIAQHWDLLQANRRCWDRRAPRIEMITGAFFGRIEDESIPVAQRLLSAMLTKWVDLQRAGGQLLELFGEALLGCYRIHDWARAPRGSVDALRKPPIKDSS